MPQWLKDAIKYLPYAWLGIKVMLQLYRAKVKQEGFREALKQQREMRVEAERQLNLERRRAKSDDERLRAALDDEARRRGQPPS